MALQSGNYVLDAQHSTVGFTVRHAMITKVHGQFTEFESVINFDADKPENSTAKATIQANSINTNNEERDNHLRSKDFFGTGESADFISQPHSTDRKSDSVDLDNADYHHRPRAHRRGLRLPPAPFRRSH